MSMIYWILIGIVAGLVTGKMVRVHTIHWSTPVDCTLGAFGGLISAALIRGFGMAGSENTSSWRVMGFALAGGILLPFIVNYFAIDRDEEQLERYAISGSERARQAEEKKLHAA